MPKKGQINVGYSGRRIGFNNTERLVGKAERYSTIEYSAIVAYAAKAAAVPESSIEMSMDAFFDAMNYFVLNGHSVQIPYLGTFSISVRAKSAESEASFTSDFAKNLKGVGIKFLPDSELKAMIASTSITTSVDTEGYEANGVISVRSAYAGYYSQLMPLNPGRPYSLDGLTRVVFNGTRLSSSYLGATPVTVTIEKIDGTTEELALAARFLSQSYNALAVNIKQLKAENQRFAGLRGIKITDAAATVYFNQSFAALPDNPFISAVVVNNNSIAENGSVKYVADQVNTIKIFGDQIDSAIIKIGGVEVTPEAVSERSATVKFTPANSGNYPITLTFDDNVVSTYNISFADQSSLSIISITANGDPLHNGSTTNIIAGTNYNVQISGTGLGALTEANFTLPSGTSIAFGSRSETMISATITNAQSGDLKVIVDDTVLFQSALVAVTPTASVTGWKASANGSAQSLSTAIQAETTGDFTAILVGSELDELATSDFSSSNCSNLSYNAATATLTGHANASSASVRIVANGTTIATLSVVIPSSGGGDDDPGDLGG